MNIASPSSIAVAPSSVMDPAVAKVWQSLHASATRMAENSPLLSALARAVVLDNEHMASGLSKILCRQQIDAWVAGKELEASVLEVYRKAPDLVLSASLDLIAVTERDPAATDFLYPFLHFKGFHALQTYRVANWFWQNGQTDLALYLQNLSSVLYGVDIHPAARIGTGIMLDHATGIVIGETSVVENNVSMLHGVTLGGTGKERGDRHPKIREGVMIGAGAKILGNIEVGKGASVAAGSVVLQDVAAHTTVAGVPARVVGKPKSAIPAREMDQTLS